MIVHDVYTAHHQEIITIPSEFDDVVSCLSQHYYNYSVSTLFSPVTLMGQDIFILFYCSVIGLLSAQIKADTMRGDVSGYLTAN